ncbi:MAG: lysine transporter LysE [Polaromonas sp.]|nr:lysine transporter LysE [Polaromonas sp.]
MLSVLLTIWILHAAALVSPGVNVLLIAQMAASDDGRGARFAALGVAAGAALWATSAVLGINLIFQAFPGVRLALQFAGGAYLLFVACRLWRSSNPHLARKQLLPLSPSAAFRLGLLTNMTNPKSALFFGSVFAASFPPEAGGVLQMCAVAMMVCNALGWHLLLAHLFSRPRVRMAYARAGTAVQRLSSVVVGGLGLGLLLTSARQVRAA